MRKVAWGLTRYGLFGWRCSKFDPRRSHLRISIYELQDADGFVYMNDYLV